MSNKYIILKLNENDKENVLEHFLNLDKESVYTRFCAPLKDDNIIQYVNKLNFENQGIFGVFDADLKLVGVGECFFIEQDGKKKAELAFSIMKDHQGQGLGNQLVQKLITFAAIEKVDEIEMYHLSSNTKVSKLARKVGMKTINDLGESHSSIHISLNEREKIDLLFQYNLEEALGTISLYQRKNMIEIVQNNQNFINFLNMNFISNFLDMHQNIQNNVMNLNESITQQQIQYFEKQKSLVDDFQDTINFFKINPNKFLQTMIENHHQSQRKIKP